MASPGPGGEMQWEVVALCAFYSLHSRFNLCFWAVTEGPEVARARRKPVVRFEEGVRLVSAELALLLRCGWLCSAFINKTHSYRPGASLSAPSALLHQPSVKKGRVKRGSTGGRLKPSAPSPAVRAAGAEPSTPPPQRHLPSPQPR